MARTGSLPDRTHSAASILNGTSILSGRLRLAGGVAAPGAEGGRRSSTAKLLAANWPSRSSPLSSGRSDQASVTSLNSTLSAPCCQRSQPMLPPPRSEPLTSRASSVWPAGKLRASCEMDVASEVLAPLHSHRPPAKVSASSRLAVRLTRVMRSAFIRS